MHILCSSPCDGLATLTSISDNNEFYWHKKLNMFVKAPIKEKQQTAGKSAKCRQTVMNLNIFKMRRTSITNDI